MILSVIICNSISVIATTFNLVKTKRVLQIPSFKSNETRTAYIKQVAYIAVEGTLICVTGMYPRCMSFAYIMRVLDAKPLLSVQRSVHKFVGRLSYQLPFKDDGEGGRCCGGRLEGRYFGV
jgi:hypothetical protein